jgi:hypothetical protein
VIIPPEVFQRLIDFFKTGKNPAHVWRGKGDWKAVYYMNEKDIDEKKVATALEELLERKFALTTANEHEKLVDEIALAAGKDSGRAADQAYASMLLNQTVQITNSEWFKASYLHSEPLKSFYANYKLLKTRQK